MFIDKCYHLCYHSDSTFNRKGVYLALKGKMMVAVYEHKDRLPAIDKLAADLKCSRSELYRRAMQRYITSERKVRKTDVS
jgi:hypothetical protein